MVAASTPSILRGVGSREKDERVGLEERLRVAERALSAIDQEAQHALHHPEISVTTMCRIATLVTHARASLGGDDDGDGTED